MIDENKDGKISKEELTKLLTNLESGGAPDAAVVEEMIKIADIDGDGKVDFAEFKKAATEGNM